MSVGVANEPLPVEQFPALTAIRFSRHAFVGRVPGLDVASDKAEALRRLDAIHGEVRKSIGIDKMPLATAEQVHGRDIAAIDRRPANDHCFAGCDG
ncbi:MAG: hypothetical protein H0U43_06575, partial [Chthoniobacterales bacterium]|nr:hypothetical protein [Chthoniobacterales bacterium]